MEFDPVEALILDLLEWIGPHPRAYTEVMDAWRTSCPRLPVWEEANERGFIGSGTGGSTEGSAGGAETGEFVTVTSRGAAFLAEHRRAFS